MVRYEPRLVPRYSVLRAVTSEMDRLKCPAGKGKDRANIDSSPLSPALLGETRLTVQQRNASASTQVECSAEGSI